MTAAMGAGAVVGGLFVAAAVAPAPVRSSPRLGFGLAILLAAAARTAARARGPASSGPRAWLLAMGNSTLQLAAPPDMRGRVMACGRSPSSAPPRSAARSPVRRRAPRRPPGSCSVASRASSPARPAAILSQRGRAAIGEQRVPQV